MVDILGYRRKLGILIPSVNTVALPDACQAAITGVTIHVSDIRTPNDSFATSAGVHGGSSPEVLLEDAMVRMHSRAPHSTALLLDEDFYAPVQSWAQRASAVGLPAFVLPTKAMSAALERTGLFSNVALLTPYSRSDTALAKARIESMGCTVIRAASLDMPSQSACARVSFVEMRRTFEDLLGDDIDGVIQLGHNLPFGRLVNNLEEDFGKPILSINQVCVWYLLRNLGIDDVVSGLGRLFLDF